MSFACFGQLLADVIAILDQPLQVGSDTRGSVTIVSGGAAANVAAWMGHNGENVSLVSRVGDDVIGRALIDDVIAEKVTPLISLDAHAPTGSVVVLVSADGERSMIPDAGASSLLDETDVEAIPAGAILYLSGYVLLHERTRAAGLTALDRALTSGTPVAVDVASASPIRAVGSRQVRSWLRGVDCILANEDEAHALTGFADPWDAAEDLAHDHRTVVIKRGAHGAIAISDGERTEVPARGGIVVVDTVGAGDAFAAGFLPVWTRATVKDALIAGTTVAARCVSQLGARPTPRQITAS